MLHPDLCIPPPFPAQGPTAAAAMVRAPCVGADVFGWCRTRDMTRGFCALIDLCTSQLALLAQPPQGIFIKPNEN